MLEGIIFFLTTILIFVYQPFTGSIQVPAFVRTVLLVILVCFGVALTIKKKAVFYYVACLLTIGAVLGVVWLKGSPGSLSFIMYFFAFCGFAVSFDILGRKLPLLKFLITRLYYTMLMVMAVLAIFAFIGFNLHIVPFSLVNLGGFDFYNYYYNPILGYIDPRRSGDGIIGRSAGFMFEPSYLSWFFATNFFLVDRMVRKKGMPVVISKAILFCGALATFSTAAMLTLGAIFGLQGGLWVLGKLGVKEKGQTIITWIIFLVIPLTFLLLPKDTVGGLFGDSSSMGNREDRMQSSLLIIAGSGVKEMVLGHAPGFIENQDTGLAESNQYMKLFIEEGAVLMLVILVFLIYCTKNKRYYMLANLIFLNSVVIMWTPLFVINILLCKWHEEPKQPEPQT